jgi:hypothetical protein
VLLYVICLHYAVCNPIQVFVFCTRCPSSHVHLKLCLLVGCPLCCR